MGALATGPFPVRLRCYRYGWLSTRSRQGLRLLLDNRRTASVLLSPNGILRDQPRMELSSRHPGYAGFPALVRRRGGQLPCDGVARYEVSVLLVIKPREGDLIARVFCPNANLRQRL